MHDLVVCIQLVVSTDVLIPDDEAQWKATGDVYIDMPHIVPRHCYGSVPRDDEDLAWVLDHVFIWLYMCSMSAMSYLDRAYLLEPVLSVV